MNMRFCRMCLLAVTLSLVVGLVSGEHRANADQGTSDAASTPGAPASVAAGAPEVLVIKSVSPSWSEYGQQIQMVLRHFTPNTTMITTDEYTDDQLRDFDRVVMVHNETTSL